MVLGMLTKLLATLLAALVFVAPFAFGGCAAVAPYLPTVIAAVTDANLVLQTIERFSDGYFVGHPDAALQKKADQAIARTRSALDLALRSANGATDLNQAKVDEAFAEFRRAYTDLIAIMAPMGLATAGPGGSMKAAPGSLVVPEPLALTLKVGQ